MSRVPHEDLVAYALGGLEEEEAAAVRAEVERDRESAGELDEIRRHLALHDRVEEIRPAPGLWPSLRARLDEPALPRTLLQRSWMPLAAAALVLAALFLPRLSPGPRPDPSVRYLHGALERTGEGTWTSTGISRMELGDGVILTLDDLTTVASPSDERLALKKAGRVFLEVSERRRGFTVEAGDLSVRTAGTAFLVEWLESGERRVWTESGLVLCSLPKRTVRVPAGHRFDSGHGELEECGGDDPRAWFRRPTLEARILAPATVAVVIRNEMPDPIRLAPPTGGEPLFYASYEGRDHPITVEEFDRPLTLAPRTERRFTLHLPRPVPDDEALFVSCPPADARVEATR